MSSQVYGPSSFGQALDELRASKVVSIAIDHVEGFAKYASEKGVLVNGGALAFDGVKVIGKYMYI